MQHVVAPNSCVGIECDAQQLLPAIRPQLQAQMQVVRLVVRRTCHGGRPLGAPAALAAAAAGAAAPAAAPRGLGAGGRRGAAGGHRLRLAQQRPLLGRVDGEARGANGLQPARRGGLSRAC